jgi:hypothetical protein
MEYISTTSLANELDISANELFAKLKGLGWIDKHNDKWVLTETGKQKGGQTRSNPKYGEYVVWPENISIDNGSSKEKGKYLNATAIGKHFSLSSQRLNLILSELGWIEKDLAGWTITKLGKNVGGKQYEHETSGGSYVLWPENILENKSLKQIFNQSSSEKESNRITTSVQSEVMLAPSIENNFRDKFEAKHRTKDGHYVRSRAEVIIDDTLYDYGLVHAYEKKIPIEEEIYTDFYLPNGKVYIEFWGLETDPKYSERKKKKLEIYKKYDLKLIELTDNDILNLDDHLPKKLLKFGIKVY